MFKNTELWSNTGHRQLDMEIEDDEREYKNKKEEERLAKADLMVLEDLYQSWINKKGQETYYD